MRSNHVVKNIVIALALLGAGFLVAWLRFRPHLETRGQFTDGERDYVSVAQEPLRYALWDRGTPVLALHDDVTSHADPALSPDGRWIVFAAGERGWNVDLWLAPMLGDQPGPARPLHELNSDADEVTPTFLGNTLYFASNRPGGAGGMDLWQATFMDGEFSATTRLPDTLNSPADETDPAGEARQGWLAFASNRERAGARDYDLYWTTVSGPKAWQPEALGALNSPAHERDPAFTADGHTVFFASDRGEEQRFALYRSVFDRGHWLEAHGVLGLGGNGHLRGPEPSPDGFRLLYSEQPLGSPQGAPRPSGVMAAPTRELFLRPSPPVGWFEILLLLALLLLALLAWLAKRWTTVEVIYRCFLVSLLVHALLMLWFQDVHPEQEPVELAERSPTYQVRLAMDSPRQRSENAERSGQLEAQRSPSEELVSQPQRAEEATPMAFAAPSPAERAVPLQAAPQSSPAAEPQAQAAPSSTQEPTPLSLQDRVAREPLYDQVAPALGVQPSPTQAERTPEASPQSSLSRAQGSDAEPKALPTPQAVSTNLATRKEREFPDAGKAIAARAALHETALPELDGPLAVPDESFSPLAQGSPSASSGLGRPTARQDWAPQRSGPADRTAGPQRAPSDAPARAFPSSTVPQPIAPLAIGPSTVGEPVAPTSPSTAHASEAQPSTSWTTMRVDLNEPTEPTASTTSSESGDLAAAAPQPGLTARAFERRRPAQDSALQRFEAERTLDRAQPMERPNHDRWLPEIAPTPVRPERQDLPFAHTPYRNRFGLAKERALAELGGSAQTEAAVASGLQYLASIQHRSGYWGLRRQNYEKYRQLRIGKTGLCLLAFLGAGHTQDRGEYPEVVGQSIRYLLGKQDQETGHFGDCSAYGHAIATYALAECYALTQDESLRRPIEKAVGQILRNQHTRREDPRFFGGWNYYYPDDEQYDSWPRVSVTAWQVMALESARLGGLSVPPLALDRARDFLRNAWDGELQAFRYNHSPSRLRDRYPTLPASTPAALFALSLLGEDLSSGTYGPARAYLTERIPSTYEFRGEQAFVFEGGANLYFWYYSSLALLRAGGTDWERWNEGLKQTLLPAQQEDGSWVPISIYAEYAADSGLDRSYTTAMCVLSLEVYYRYFTPLLQTK